MIVRRPTGRSLAVATIALLLPSSAGGTEDPIAAVRAEMAALRAQFESRMSELEERLRAVEGETDPTPSASELDQLQAEARAAAKLSDSLRPPAPEGARSLNRLNPEISFTGIFAASASDLEREEFRLSEMELDFQSVLDPYSRTRWTIAVDEAGEFEIEEGYVLYSALPGGLTLSAGRFRQSFGPLNRQHAHALPQSEYPMALTTIFGEEGLAQTGVSAHWLLPRPWATANQLTLQVTDGESDFLAGEDFDSLAYLARLENFWETGAATWVEWGLSGLAGETGDGGDGRVWGSDLTFHWQPPQRAKYREITWRSELLRAERDSPAGTLESWSGYSYLEGLVARNLSLGLRWDVAEDPLSPGPRRVGWVPYLTWWQSEWVRLRAEYGHLEDRATGESENRFTFQLTWAAGPHKHESY